MGSAMPDDAGAYKQQGIDYSWDVKIRNASYWKTQRLLILLPLLVSALG
jgi:hypothetical protein